MAKFHQFSPKELYELAKRELQPPDPDAEIPGLFSPKSEPCPAVLLEYGKIFIRQGKQSVSHYARILGIVPEALRQAFPALTNKKYSVFAEEFFLCMLEDTLSDDVKYGTLEEKARMLGMSPSGLYRFMTRELKRTPTGRTWRYTRAKR